jgi:hypothetical protein
MKTGRQVFKDEIFDKIDSTVKIKEIVEDLVNSVRFIVCELKWMRVGQPFTDARNVVWTIGTIDTETREIFAIKPANDAELNKGESIEIKKPFFRSGTPTNTSNEWSKNGKSILRTMTPLIWLREPIEGEIYDLENSYGRSFNPDLYFLDEVGMKDTLNADRHGQVVVPMNALMFEVLRVIDDNPRIEREGSANDKTYPIFGSEEPDGSVRAWWLKEPVGGVGCRPTVKATNEACNC